MTKTGLVYEDRTCALPGCAVVFTPLRRNQKFCCPAHGSQHANARRTLHGLEAVFMQPRKFETYPVKLQEDEKVIIVNDLQMPFHSIPVLEAVEKFWNDWQPDLEIYNGDILDYYEISDHDKNPSRLTNLQAEIDIGRLWVERRVEAVPNARRVWIDGNHEDRMRRWLWRHDPALSSLRALALPTLLGLDEYKMQYLMYGSRVDILGFLVEHGHRVSGGAVYSNGVAALNARDKGSSGMAGHSHRLEAFHFTDSRGSHTYYSNGCLCIQALEYKAFPNWQHGFSYGVAHKGQLHIVQVTIYPTGFRAEGEFYPILKGGK